MEPVSLAAPLVSQLFDVAKAGYRLADNFKSTGRDSRSAFTKLEMEDQRFRAIGTVMRLGQQPWPGLGDEYLNRAVTNTLCSINFVFTDAMRLAEKYGLQKDDQNVKLSEMEAREDALAAIRNIDYSSLSDVHPVSQQLDRYKAIVKHTQSSLSTLRKCRWALIDRDKFYKLVQELRHFNDALYHILPRETRSTASEILNYELLGTNDILKLDEISAAGLESYPQISRRAAVKRETLLPQDGVNDDISLVISDGTLDYGSYITPGRSLAGWTEPNDEKTIVLIEWKRKGFVSNQLSERQRATVVLERIHKLVRLLKSKAPEEFRTLECVGYCDEAQIGLVYKFPANALPNSRPWSLEQLLSSKEMNQKLFQGKPPLEMRFRLAHALALALAGFHGVNWLHKGMSPANILFFPKTSALDIDITMPYLTGFDFSRDFGDKDLSEEVDIANDLYRHPKHSSTTHFDKSFDIYALGLILLQIAFWKPLSSLANLEDPKGKQRLKSHSEVREHVLTYYIENGMLRYLKGSGYARAVSYCLNLGFGIEFDDSLNPMAAGSYFCTVTSGLSAFQPSPQ